MTWDWNTKIQPSGLGSQRPPQKCRDVLWCIFRENMENENGSALCGFSELFASRDSNHPFYGKQHVQVKCLKQWLVQLKMSWLFNNKYLSKKQFSSTYLISILMHYSVKWIIFEFVTNCQSVCCFNHLSHQTAMDICQWPHTNAKREVSHGKINLRSIIVSLLSLHWPLTLLHLLSLWEAYTNRKGCLSEPTT